MLDNRTVLAKTDSGREAIANRTHNLNPRQRAVLISINGETDVGRLVARFGGDAPTAAMALIESLIEYGLAVPLNDAAPGTSLPAETKRRGLDAPIGPDADDRVDVRCLVHETRSESSGTRPSETEPVNGAGPARPSPDARAASVLSWRDMQLRASDSLHAAMGNDADLLAMRLMRSRSETEFLGHMERAFDLIRTSRGEAAAMIFHSEVSGSA